jgi:cell division protein FtsB
VARDWRDDQIEDLLARNAVLMAQVEKLTARVAALEDKVRKSSRNSSRG